jgi:hypothetical protein
MWRLSRFELPWLQTYALGNSELPGAASAVTPVSPYLRRSSRADNIMFEVPVRTAAIVTSRGGYREKTHDRVSATSGAEGPPAFSGFCAPAPPGAPSDTAI